MTSLVAANALLNLIFQGTTWAGIAQNAAVSPATTFYAALHSSDPGSQGTQATNEVAYTGYARVAIPRSAAGFTTATAGSTSPVAPITFPPGTAGQAVATYWSIGLASSGAGTILFSGPITPNVVCGAGFTPVLSTASAVVVA